jgi:hypothetical protein
MMLMDAMTTHSTPVRQAVAIKSVLKFDGELVCGATARP